MTIRTLSAVCSAILAVTLSVPTPLVAQSISAAPAADAYTRAVQEYISAAEKEIALIQKEVSAKEKANAKADLADLKASLKACNRKIDELKASGPARFDVIKKEYESSRATMVGLLGQLRQGS